MAKRKALTANEKAFLSIYVRTDEKDKQVAAYRECGCRHADSTDGKVSGMINRLTARPDAQLVMRADAARRQATMLQRMQVADERLTDELFTDQEMRQAVKTKMFDQFLREGPRLEEKDKDGCTKRSATGFSQLGRELLKTTEATGKAAGMTEEESVAIFEAMWEEKKRFTAADMLGPVNPDVEAKLAAAQAELEGAE